MAEPRRFPSSAAAPATRDGQVDTLLVEGLDRYFGGDYEGAIHLWTRVLFLDRAHARARAYINRARTAIAERQRRAEEMLDAAAKKLAAGEIESARELVGKIVAAIGEDERVAALRQHLERVERAHRLDRSETRAAAVVDAVPLRPRAMVTRRLVVAVTATAIGAVVAAFAAGLVIRNWRGLATADQDLTPMTALSSSDSALNLAQDLYGRGRLAEALKALDLVDPQSARAPAVVELRGKIEALLASGRAATPVAPAGRP